MNPSESTNPSHGTSASAPSHYIDSIQIMRGIAALLVVLEHLVGRPGYPIFNKYLAFLDGLGSVGVSAFFVISGMVLPLSLGKDYRWNLFPVFLLRRSIRIEPTYLVSVAFASVLIFGMSLLAPHSTTWFPSLKQLALHALYLIPFTHEEWIQPVYWTLAVEFQFYLCIGLIFPVIIASSRKGRLLPTALLCASFRLLVMVFPWIHAVRLFQYATCFAIGMLVAGRRLFGFGLPLVITLCVLLEIIGFHNGQSWRVLLGSGLAALVALFCTGPVSRKARFIRRFWFLGTISYSLYVIHQVIASAGENISRMILRKIHGSTGVLLANLVPVGSLIAAFFAAWLLYRFVEKPTHEFSRKFRILFRKGEGAMSA